MNTKLKRLLLPLLKAVKEGKPITFRMRSAASQGIFLIGKGTKKPSQGRLRRVSKRSTKNEETAKIREAVFQRANGLCEGTGGHGADKNCSGPLQLDHWLSGSGRRREKQSLETTWLLCLWHHRRRTANLPCAAEWNDRFAEHCAKYGYPVIEHIVHEPIARKAQ